MSWIRTSPEIPALRTHCLTALATKQVWLWGDLPLSLGLSQLSTSTGTACWGHPLLLLSGIATVKLTCGVFYKCR